MLTFFHEKTQMIFLPSNSIVRSRNFVRFKEKSIKRTNEKKILGVDQIYI